MAQLTATQLRQSLADRLAQSPGTLSPADRSTYVDAALLQLITDPSRQSEAKRRVDKDLLNSKVAYAIPDDALDLFPSLVRAVVGAFTSGPAGALADLAGILIRYRGLKVEITAEEAAVLAVLGAAKVQNSPPLAPAEIAARLEDQGLAPQHPIAALLVSLKGKQTKEATLVLEADGRWSIGNV